MEKGVESGCGGRSKGGPMNMPEAEKSSKLVNIGRSTDM
jgi:hypothetical protein